MADGQAQTLQQSFAQPQVPHHTVAATIISPSHSKPKASAYVDQDEGSQLDELYEMQEELPPYDSVSAERFVMDLNEGHCCNCSDPIQWFSDQRPGSSTKQCPTPDAYDDFILFPSSSSCCSKQDSSVVSCFTDDLSHSTECTDTLSAHPSMDPSAPSPQSLMRLTLQGCCQDWGQDQDRSFANIASWLCDVEKEVGCTSLRDTLLHGAMTSTDTIEQKSAGAEEPAI